MKYFILLISLWCVACTSKNEIGSENNPIQFALVPGQDSVVLMENGKVLQRWIEEQTGLHVKMQVPTSFIAVVEAFGSKRVDVAILNTFGYILAHDKYGTEALLIGVNKNRSEYWGQIIAKDPRIRTIADLKGKKFAFVDPASTSGYILPAKLLKDSKIKLGETVFAGKHDSVVTMVYQGRADAGAVYYAPPEDGAPQDARKLVSKQFPDVFEKIHTVKITDSIPSDPVVFRKDLPPEIKNKLVAALKSFSSTEQGKQALKELYLLTGFKDCTDKTYDPVRQNLLDLGKDVQDLVK